MKRYIFLLMILSVLLTGYGQNNRTRYFPKLQEFITKAPDKSNVWVFILAGQSNMAGRGLVEPQDTLPDERILTINAAGQLLLAKEPLHFQEPGNEGLDCGLSFGRELTKALPLKIKVLIIPAAIGGSSVSQWLGDSLHRNVRLLSNVRDKIETGKKYGQVKAILWHQGENDANPRDIPLYSEKLDQLFEKLRSVAGNKSLPVIMGELGNFPRSHEGHLKINQILMTYCQTDKNAALIATADLNHKGDSVHFDSEGQRLMGRRFAQEYLKKFR